MPTNMLDLEDDEEYRRTGTALTSFSTPRSATAEPKFDEYDPFGENSLTPSAPMPKRSAIGDLASHQQEIPQVPKVKPWQRILAGAIGGGAGYLNAGGRNHINVEPAIQGIYAGDYPRQLENWKLKQAGLTTRANIEEKQMQERRQQTVADSTIERNRATTARANKLPPTYGDLYQQAIDGNATPAQAHAFAAQGHNPPAPTRPTVVGPGSQMVDSEGNKVGERTPPNPPAPTRLIPVKIEDEVAGTTTVIWKDPTTGVEVRRDPPEKTPKLVSSRGPTYSGTLEDINDTAQMIFEGKATPEISKYSMRDRTALVGALKRMGYDQATAERDYKAITKHLSVLNGAQQMRLRQAVTFAYDHLKVVDDLYRQWAKASRASGYKSVNKAALVVTAQLPGEVGSLAQNLQAQINDFTSEMGTVYKGGNSSTDETLKLAAGNLKSDWNEETWGKAIGLLKTSLTIRKNSMSATEAVGVTPGSPYAPPVPEKIPLETPPQSAGQQGGATDRVVHPPPQAGKFPVTFPTNPPRTVYFPTQAAADTAKQQAGIR